MKNQFLTFSLVIVSLAFCCSALGQTKAMESSTLNGNSVYFQENKGQVSGDDASRVKYTLHAAGLKVFLMDNGITYQFEQLHEDTDENQRRETYRIDLELVGGNTSDVITTDGQSTGFTNYYNLNALKVHGYKQVTYHNVYPKIDWVLYTLNGSLKYDFVVRPGGNPENIKLKVKWAEKVSLGEDGSYNATCSLGTISESAPMSFQGSENVATAFILEDNIIRFSLGEYNPDSTLRIDPNVVWSTYYGGTEIDYGQAVAYDKQGNIFLAGDTKSSANIAKGGHQNTYVPTYYSAFLVKFNGAGVRQWGTYFGGSSEERVNAVAVDGSGNIYLAGKTHSSNGIFKDGFKSKLSGTSDGFLAKFNTSGSFLWGTYYGSGGIDEVEDIAIDKSDNVYITGFRKTTNFLGFFAKFNSAGKHQWYRTLGSGTFSTYGTGISVDANGNIFMGGYTYLSSGIASSGHQNTYGGGGDAFLTKYNDQGTLQWGTYYGGSSGEFATDVQCDGNDNVYLIGTTQSSSGIASSGHQNTFGGGRDAFIAKFNNSGTRQWASYYGGSANDDFNAIAFDTAQNAYLAGNSGTTSGITSNGIQNTYGGGNSDAILVKLDSDGKRLWATYFGGNDLDYGRGVAIDKKDNIHLAGYTLSKSFYGKKGHQNTFGGNRDAYLAKISQCIANPGTDVQTACDSYKWIDGKTYTASTNTPQFTLTSTDGCDSVVTLNLTINISPKRTYTVSACGSYTVVGGKTYTQSGTYNYSKASASACDSIITLKLTITTVKTDVVVNRSTLSAVEASGTYQWLNCSNFAPIAGETRRSFKAVENGDYAVEITKNNCIDTSDCTNVKPVGIEDVNTLSVQVYPNPSDGIINIVLHQYPNANVELYNSAGQKCFIKEGITAGVYRLNRPDLLGVYTLKVSSREGVYFMRLLMH